MSATNPSAILSAEPIGELHWPGQDPFLFCAHHNDKFPNDGNGKMGLDAKHLRGRNIGSDFSGKDGFNLYHGTGGKVGFPRHPHTGFETLTIVREGLCDHSDSLGMQARFGGGDAQWITTGAGMSHSEMFPLINQEGPNPLDLFQIWINLPREKKEAKPCFTLAWSEDQPRASVGKENKTHIRLVGGQLAGLKGVAPPPDSWGADPRSDLLVATLRLEPGAQWTLPKAADEGVGRALYVFSGETSKLSVAGRTGITRGDGRFMVKLNGAADVELAYADAAKSDLEILILQGRPLKEPVVQQGPFVANTREGLEKKFREYRSTEFQGWPYKEEDPIHPRDAGRFAIIDGKKLRPPTWEEGKAA